jgi:hypothetical protein
MTLRILAGNNSLLKPVVDRIKLLDLYMPSRVEETELQEAAYTLTVLSRCEWLNLTAALHQILLTKCSSERKRNTPPADASDPALNALLLSFATAELAHMVGLNTLHSQFSRIVNTSYPGDNTTDMIAERFKLCHDAHLQYMGFLIVAHNLRLPLDALLAARRARSAIYKFHEPFYAAIGTTGLPNILPPQQYLLVRLHYSYCRFDEMMSELLLRLLVLANMLPEESLPPDTPQPTTVASGTPASSQWLV